jgi:hypothetical protein
VIAIAAKLSVSKPVNFDTECKAMRFIFLILLSVAPFASSATGGVIRTYNAWLAEFNAELATGPTDAQMRNWTFYNMPFTDPTPMPFADPTRTLTATAGVIRTYSAWLA